MIDLIRAIISSVIEGKIKRFTASGRPNETFTDREFFQQYGFTSRPLQGAEAIVLKKGNQIFMIASDDRRYRIALDEGEVALYTDEGDFIHFKRGGKIQVDATSEVEVNAPTITVNGTTKVEVTAPAINMTGTVTLTGNVGITGTVHATGAITSDGNIIDSGSNTNHHSHP